MSSYVDELYVRFDQSSYSTVNMHVHNKTAMINRLSGFQIGGVWILSKIDFDITVLSEEDAIVCTTVLYKNCIHSLNGARQIGI